MKLNNDRTFERTNVSVVMGKGMSSEKTNQNYFENQMVLSQLHEGNLCRI